MRRTIFICLSLICLGSCKWMDDLQHMTAPEIISIEPEGEILEADNVDSVTIRFSEKMNRPSVEAAFSLNDEFEGDLDGIFSWEENRMQFTPYYGFSPDREYRISLKNDAEDRYGNSLDRDWFHLFSTGSDTVPPVLLSADPADLSALSGKRQELNLSFSEAVNKESFRISFSISPDILIDQEWNDTGDSVTITPLEDYEEGEDYRITLSTDLEDLCCNAQEEEVELYYKAWTRTDLQLSSFTVDTSTDLLDYNSNSGAINEGLFQGNRLQGTLSRAADYEERNNLITLKPSLLHTIDWSEDYIEFELTFKEPPVYNGYYDLSVLDSLYVLHMNGAKGIPYNIPAVNFCPDSTAGSPVFTPLRLNSNLGAIDGTTAFFDFYIKHPPSDVPDLSNFIDALSIESSVITWDYLSVEVFDGTQTPAPQPVPEEDVSLIRLYTEVNYPGLPGIVNISLDETFCTRWTLTVSLH